MRCSWVLLLGAALLMICLGRCAAKRFDCENFCKTTRFSGVIGGCRCGFTLFTSKRSGHVHMRAPSPPLPLAISEQGERLMELPRHAAVREGDLNVLMPYLFFRDVRNRGQKEVMEDTDFHGKNDLVFGNMYQ
ncbi:uncharacterized protein LOC122380938 [Amphibalanus amphitrite]|uniref:uncharacterized protein LOC122380938 n=1 Tax=Amphibalanus amphitrite TaxID=1232801 RepID=UPI001C916E75|nr:uncharacterized protein LOC122380938 [Amphibalanus amphitrite]XP_043220524.1 uncharacterized protein LOC122380938 [Amphibalanus amphitrite]